ncbi:MAG TPA: HAD family hydrolase [candidate division Zixibacteria bacterium]|nr:HAD family hydrolase [candidate division Zixibacteria bacterium]
MTINTLLFDMDSTLISIDEQGFSKKYFHLLHKTHFYELDFMFFVDAMVDITRYVMTTKLPKELTVDTFVKEMSKHFEISPEEIKSNLLDFYHNEYSQLKSYIRPVRGVKKLIKNCFAKGYDVVVATTPIFPEVAIMKRLKWGGLHNFDYKLVTHAENMYYSKPQEEYYTEVLSKINKEINECLMIGNEFMADIIGPTKLGMKTFYSPLPSINDELFVSPELKRFSKIRPSYQGTMSDLAKLIDNGLE